jgi:hypothetical protein
VPAAGAAEGAAGPGRLVQALLVRWAWPESRAYLEGWMLGPSRIVAAFARKRLGALAGVVESGFPPNGAVWYAYRLAGCGPGEAFSRLPEAAREKFRERQAALRDLRERLQAVRASRYELADDARARAARAEAERLTRHLQWRADRAEDKLRRVQLRVRDAVRDREAAVRRLEGELEADWRGRRRGCGRPFSRRAGRTGRRRPPWPDSSGTGPAGTARPSRPWPASGCW